MDMQAIIGEKISTLTSLIGQAQKAQAASTGPVQSFGKSVTSLSKLIGTDDMKSALIAGGVGVNAILELERASLPFLSLDPLSMDRSEGDKLSTGLLSLVEMGLLEGSERDLAESLVEAWTATAPKRTRHSTSGATPGSGAKFGPLGFTVTVQCDRCAFKASTTRDNLNSIRDQIKTHEADAHQTPKDAMTRATTFHANITGMLDSVMHAPHAGLRVTDGWEVRRVGEVPAVSTPEPTQPVESTSTQGESVAA